MKPISKDLRNRVINHLEKGNTYASTARKFEVSESSARVWHLRYKQTGSFEAKPYPGKKPRLTESEFVHYIDSHPNSTLSQIGANFKMTARSAHYYMRKFGFSYKKKSPVTWRQNQSNEANTKKI